MQNRITWIVSLGVLVAAITTGITIGTQLSSEQAQLITLAASVGIIVGLPLGLAASYFGPQRHAPDKVTVLRLNSEQEAALFDLLYLQQGNTSPQRLPSRLSDGQGPPAARTERRITSVGGAQLDE